MWVRFGIAPQYAALTCTRDVDWSAPEQAADMAAYQKFGQEHAAAIRGGAVLHPTATATTVRVTGARGGDVVTGDGPYEAADLDEQGPFPMETVYLWEDGPNGTTRMTL